MCASLDFAAQFSVMLQLWAWQRDLDMLGGMAPRRQPFERHVLICAAAKLPSNQLVASRMTACVVLAAETAAIVGYLLYVAPLMPDCLPQTVVLCTLVLVSYYLHYRWLFLLLKTDLSVSCMLTLWCIPALLMRQWC